MKGKGSGWKGESRRHSLARKGIKTAKGRRTSLPASEWKRLYKYKGEMVAMTEQQAEDLLFNDRTLTEDEWEELKTPLSIPEETEYYKELANQYNEKLAKIEKLMHSDLDDYDLNGFYDPSWKVKNLKELKKELNKIIKEMNKIPKVMEGR